jgi:predicted ATP-grasp superfamily ATP-dependent carboligase
MTRVFVTDGEQRPALAIVRSLARHGVSVVVGSDQPVSLSSCSRYCSGRVTYPSPYSAPDRFTRWLEDFLARERIDAVLPVTDVTMHLVTRNAAALRRFSALPVPRFEAFDFISDKGRLVEWAAQCGVRAPRTEFVDGERGLHAVIDRVAYPAVVKPVRSRYLTATGWHGTGVHYAGSRDDLLKLYEHVDYLSALPSLIQERISGPGVGMFVLFDRGRPIADFAHRRLREKPPSGGVSVLRESVPVDPVLRRWASRLLEPLDWHGVAMLEFKRDAVSGDPYLIEVNGRFWGSLQLAIDAGLDFPWLSLQLALGATPALTPAYREGVRSRWLLGDLDHLLLRLTRTARELQMPDAPAARPQAVRDFLKCFGRDLHYEVEKLADPGPALFEWFEYARALFASALAHQRIGSTRRVTTGQVSAAGSAQTSSHV